MTRTAPDVDPRATPGPTPVGEVASAQATPEPDAGQSGTYRVGDVVTVADEGEPLAEIVVDRVSSKARYGTGYYADRPPKGKVFLAAEVTYRALADHVAYGGCDWQALAAGEGVEQAAVLKGPQPSLASGSLRSGGSATGWLVFEVPKKGRVVLAYRGTMFGEGGEPVFTVVLRAK